ncbi:MAG: class I SAM-dependent methyltransferase [Halobacteriales archaeon]
MRRFSAEYLRRTRRGMWADSRAALGDLDLAGRKRVLDAGAGTGELTAVLHEETDAEVVAVDADPALLAETAPDTPVVAGDATRLPFPVDAFDLVVCQALLINLPDPAAAVAEFARVSSDLVAAIEPDNGAVSITSTVDAEATVTARARKAFLAGVDTDPTLGGEGARELLAGAGLDVLGTRRYVHEHATEPPYAAADLAAARRKATGEALDRQRGALLAGPLDEASYDELRADWRAMGRRAVEQMQRGEYRRREHIPFYVTVGTVGETDDGSG